jgi:hypothetical protein
VTKAKKPGDKKPAKSKNTGDEGRSNHKVACTHGTGTLQVDRRASKDRRGGCPDRRVENVPVAVERRKLERRVKVSRRRQIDPTTCERDYTPEEIQFMTAMDEYKRLSGRMFPTCSEILEVLKKLGYERREPTESMPISQPPADVVGPVEQATSDAVSLA